jgi:transposase
LLAREQAVDVRRSGLNELRALLVTAPEPLRIRLRGLSRARLLGTCLRLRRGGGPDARACVLALRACAQRVLQADA